MKQKCEMAKQAHGQLKSGEMRKREEKGECGEGTHAGRSSEERKKKKPVAKIQGRLGLALRPGGGLGTKRSPKHFRDRVHLRRAKPPSQPPPRHRRLLPGQNEPPRPHACLSSAASVLWQKADHAAFRRRRCLARRFWTVTRRE